MIRVLLAAGFVATSLLLAQSSSGSTFEVASVKPAAPTQQRAGRSSGSGDRINYTNTTMLGLIASAYNVRGFQIEGPPWIRTERYDVAAKAPDGTPKDQIPLMLRSLLADRFKLTIHHETRELPAYALILVKESPKLEKAEGEAIGGADLGVDGHRKFLRTTMDQLVLYFDADDRPAVLNKTNLAGAYNFPLDLSMEEMGGVNASDAQPRASVFTSL